MSNRPVCLITGASRGIGASTARRFAAEGYDLFLSSRNERELQPIANELIREFGVDVHCYEADLALPTEAGCLVAGCYGAFQRIDVLVNNAGTAPNTELTAMAADEIARTIALNVTAVVESTKTVLTVMKRQGNGVIVNVSSLAAIDPFPGFSVYGGTKAFVETFTKAVAAECKSDGIRAFCVRPGAVDTSLLRSLFPDFPVDQRLAPSDVAGLIHALCSEGLRHSSGEAITIKR